MNVKRWMRDWQTRFDTLGVEVIVADVAQSSVVVNLAERTIILAPHLSVSSAERMLHNLYKLWECWRTERRETESCALMSC